MSKILSIIDWFMRKVYPHTIPVSSTDNETSIPIKIVPEAPKLPKVESKPTEPVSATKKPTLAEFCLGLRDYEGKPGNRNYKNNNPGNVRYSPVGYLPMYEPVKKDKDNFAIFKDMETGMLYLQNMIKAKIHLHPEQTIYTFMCSYAPTSDGNDPLKYSEYLAKRLGVDNRSFLMRDLVY